MKLPAISGFAAILLLFGILPARSQTDPAGIWLTQAGDARVQVSRCGGGICGRIVWLRDPIDRVQARHDGKAQVHDNNTGQPQLDDKNPNPALAQRPMIGLSIFIGMQAAGANKWSGRIYNADDGKTYTAHVTVQSETALEVQGCVGMLCGGETWTRVTPKPAPASAAKKRPAKQAD